VNVPPGGARNLKYDPKGYWYAKDAVPLSYPADGNDTCFSFEDDSFWFRHRNNVISTMMRQFPPGGAIFDIGGGNGYVAAGLERAGFSTVLVEPGRVGAENACRRGLRKVVNATVETAQFVPGSADAVGLFDVLEHIQDESAFLASIRRLMKPGGRIYLTVPAFQLLWSKEDDFAGHYRRYSQALLTKVLSDAGFHVEFASYFIWFLPLPIFFLRAIPSRLGWRGKPSTNRAKQEHTHTGFTAKVIDWVLSNELSRLNSKRTIPLGGSCIAVARLPGSRLARAA